MNRLSIPVRLAAAAVAHAAGSCGASQDLLVRALERLGDKPETRDIEDSLQLVKKAIEGCAGLGDAWYYRSVFEAKLGSKPRADFALRQARELGSEAMQQGADPFRIAAPPGRPPSKVLHDKYALVIGVGKFASKDIPALNLTTKDARDFAAVLGDPAYGRFPKDHVHLLTGSQATTVKIKEELNWLARTAGPDDMAVIYLSSHGSSREMDTAGANYVITYDTDIQDADHLYATALPMVEVADVVRTRMQAQRAAVFLDTCHSGGAIAGSRSAIPIHAATASDAMLKRMDQGMGRVIIASSRVSEQSWESQKLGNGFFTYFLVQGIRQGMANQPVSALFDYLNAQVPKAVEAEVHAAQHPVMSRSDQGADQIVLGVAPGSAVAITSPRRFSIPVVPSAF
jgi:hypothetical protein